MTVKQISALALKHKLGQLEEFVLLDVREPGEYEYAKIDGSILIPLNQLPLRYQEFDPFYETVVMCHHGIRSQQAAMFLQSVGFSQVSNLAGGIDAWSIYCDNKVMRY